MVAAERMECPGFTVIVFANAVADIARQPKEIARKPNLFIANIMPSSYKFSIAE